MPIPLTDYLDKQFAGDDAAVPSDVPATGTAFPVDEASLWDGKLFIFDAAVQDGLIWFDQNGNQIASARPGDVAKYNRALIRWEKVGEMNPATSARLTQLDIINDPAVHQLLFHLEPAHAAGDELGRGGFTEAYQVNNDAVPSVQRNPSTLADLDFTAADRTLADTGFGKLFSTIDIKFGDDLENIIVGTHILLQYKTDNGAAVDFIRLHDGELQIRNPADANDWRHFATNADDSFTPAPGENVNFEIVDNTAHPGVGLTIIPWAARADGTAIDFNDIFFDSGAAEFTLDNIIIPNVQVGAPPTQNTYTPITRLVLAAHGGTYYRHSLFNTTILPHVNEDFMGVRYVGTGSATIRYIGSIPALGFEAYNGVAIINNGANDAQAAPAPITLPAALVAEFQFVYIEGVDGDANQLLDANKTLPTLQTGDFDADPGADTARFQGNDNFDVDVLANGDVRITWLGAGSSYYWTNIYVHTPRRTIETYAQWQARTGN